MDHHVTLVSGVRLRTGAQDAHRTLHNAGVSAARAQGGLVRDELIPAVPGVQDETVALLTFADRAALDRWMRSDERARIIDRMAELSLADRSLNVLAGFPGWFVTPGAIAPARWKQALVVIVGLIPTSLLVTELREAMLPGLSVLSATMINAIANVCLLTWVVLPPLNQVFAGWLLRQRHRHEKRA